MPEVDHSASATLASAPGTPTNLAETARTGNDVAGRWPFRQMELKFPVLLIAQKVIDSRSEDASFDDDHMSNIRQWRMRRQHPSA